MLSGDQYPTANLYFDEVAKVRLSIQLALTDSDKHIREMAPDMQDKFDKYWDDFSPILAVASVLDPRNKMDVVGVTYQEIYGEMRGPEETGKVKDL